MQIVFLIAIGVLAPYGTWASCSSQCSGRSFGYKVQDFTDNSRYYICLGALGPYAQNCDNGYRFNELEQRCVNVHSMNVQPNNGYNTGIVPFSPLVQYPQMVNPSWLPWMSYHPYVSSLIPVVPYNPSGPCNKPQPPCHTTTCSTTTTTCSTPTTTCSTPTTTCSTPTTTCSTPTTTCSTPTTTCSTPTTTCSTPKTAEEPTTTEKPTAEEPTNQPCNPPTTTPCNPPTTTPCNPPTATPCNPPTTTPCNPPTTTPCNPPTATPCNPPTTTPCNPPTTTPCNPPTTTPCNPPTTTPCNPPTTTPCNPPTTTPCNPPTTTPCNPPTTTPCNPPTTTPCNPPTPTPPCHPPTTTPCNPPTTTPPRHPPTATPPCHPPTTTPPCHPPATPPCNDAIKSQNSTPNCRKYRNGACIRDKVNRRKYYVCLNGKAISQSCPKGLIFDDEAYTCRFENHELDSNEDSHEYEPEKDTYDSPEDCADAPNGTYIRDPYLCNKFYVCFNGQAFSKVCDAGKCFDNKRLECDYKKNVKNCPIRKRKHINQKY